MSVPDARPPPLSRPGWTSLVPSIACRIRHAVSQPRGVGRGGRRRGVIVVDSSVVVAILFGEPAAEALLARLAMDF